MSRPTDAGLQSRKLLSLQTFQITPRPTSSLLGKPIMRDPVFFSLKSYQCLKCSCSGKVCVAPPQRKRFPIHSWTGGRRSSRHADESGLWQSCVPIFSSSSSVNHVRLLYRSFLSHFPGHATLKSLVICLETRNSDFKHSFQVYSFPCIFLSRFENGPFTSV